MSQYYKFFFASLCVALVGTAHCIEDPGQYDPLAGVQLPIHWEQVVDADIDVHRIGEPTSLPILDIPDALQSWTEIPLAVERNMNEKTCTAPNNGGLMKFLVAIKSTMPLTDIRMIIRQAISTDPEVQMLKRLIESAEFRMKLQILRKSPQVAILRDFSCEKLYLDLKVYADFVKSLFDLHTSTETDSLMSSNFSNLRVISARAGVAGLCHDIIEILPIQKISSLYKAQIATDEYFQLAVQTMKSEDFLQILSNIHESKEFLQLIDMFDTLALPVHKIRDVIGSALGWHIDATNADIVYLLNL